MVSVFDGIRVVDFTRGMPGGIATMVMADNGADVIKVEPPGGDPFRRINGARQWHRGKKSVVLDLKTDAGREHARRLAASADVVIESFRPGVAERLGIGYDDLSRDHNDLIYCSITGFGRKGPYANYKGYEAVVMARGGRMMDYQGQVDRPGPTFIAQPALSFAASQLALQGITAALYVRERTGRGQRVDATLLQGIGVFDLNNWASGQLHHMFPQSPPTLSVGLNASLHYLVAQTKDGAWLQFSNLHTHLFTAFVRAVELEDVFRAAGMIGDATVAIGARPDTEDLFLLLLERIREKTYDEWMDIFLRDPDIGVDRFRHAEQVLDHPQLIHNGEVVEIDDPEVGRTRQVGPLINFTKSPSKIGAPAPTVGQHTDEVLGAVPAIRGAAIRNGQSLPQHPLDGITVLELATWYAAPYAATLLADLGARVIKVEPLEGDSMRAIWVEGGLKTFQNKESIAIDLRTERGQAIFHRLAKDADLLIHNYRLGVPERLGIDYATLSKINSRLIYLDASSYGTSGPYAGRPAWHAIFGSGCGEVLYQAGHSVPPIGPPLDSIAEIRRVGQRMAKGNVNSDPNSALAAASGLLMALYHRERTGEAQYLERTMLCANAYANSDDSIQWAGKPARKLPDGELYGLGALYRLYRCSEGWAFLAAPSDEEWAALCRAIGRDDLLSDGRFRDAGSREKHDSELAAVLEGIFATRPAAEWEKLLTDQDVACVVADAGQYYQFFASDPHVDAAGMAVEVEHPAWGKYRRHSPMVELSLTPGCIGPGSLCGEHTRKLLSELGYSKAEAAELRQAGIVGWPDDLIAAGRRNVPK